ncbi:hypothetical protein BaRGS_00001589 [Batillaria attramentaria]|uniref:Phosphatidylinositol-glycan biosynthesis class X protein n=1 Tax=Batillaria attramentaria TaxID=370345 RepID=A0ABD0M8A9_9CAEN
MEITNIQLILMVVVSLSGSGVARDVLIDLNRQVLRDGFHRDLRTTLKLQQDDLRQLPGRPCSVLLVENLPSGLYVDTFQLENLAAVGGPQVLTDRPVDIEAPEYLSSQHKLYVYTPVPVNEGSLDGTITIFVSLPVHVRYHKPTENPDVTHVRDSEYVELQVPVGRQQDIWTVIYSSLVVTVLGCTFLLYIIVYYDKWRVRPKES